MYFYSWLFLTGEIHMHFINSQKTDITKWVATFTSVFVIRSINVIVLCTVETIWWGFELSVSLDTGSNFKNFSRISRAIIY